jgi:hypothetical protein
LYALLGTQFGLLLIHDEPIGVLMLLRGYPEFYYSKPKGSSSLNTQKGNFLMVEQGVLLKSIEAVEMAHSLDLLTSSSE